MVKRITAAVALMLALVCPKLGQAQTVFWTDRAVGTFPFPGGGGMTSLVPIQYGPVRVCTSADIGSSTSPCPHPASITDILGNPLSIVGGNFGQLNTDVVGRFSFGCTPGVYLIQVAASGSNVPQLNYPITCPSGTSALLTSANTWTALQSFSAITTQSFNGDLWVGPGVGQFSSISACVAALSAGQTCHVTANWVDPTWTSNLVINKTNIGLRFHGAATINMSTFSITKASGNFGFFIRTENGSSQPGVTFLYTGSGTAFSIGDSAADSKGVVLQGITIDSSGASNGVTSITLARNQLYLLDGIKCFGSGAANGQTCINLDGTGNYTGSGLINNPFIGSVGTGINFTGVVAGFFAGNANKVTGGFITNCVTGVNFGVGVSNIVDDIAIQTCTTAANFANNASVAANRISFYTAGNTTDVAFNGGTASGNYADVLGTAVPVVTGTRGNNTVNWTPNLNWDAAGNVTAAAGAGSFRGYLEDGTGCQRVSWVGTNGVNTFFSACGGTIFMQNVVSFASNISSFNGTATAGNGLPSIHGATLQKAETGAADANVLTFTPPALAGNYRACFSASVSSATAGVISWTLSWTDSNGNAQSNIAQPLFQFGTAAPNTTFTTSATGNYEGCSMIDVNNASANIVVKWVGGGTTAAKVSSTVERLQ